MYIHNSYEYNSSSLAELTFFNPIGELIRVSIDVDPVSQMNTISNKTVATFWHNLTANHSKQIIDAFYFGDYSIALFSNLTYMAFGSPTSTNPNTTSLYVSDSLLILDSDIEAGSILTRVYSSGSQNTLMVGA